MSGATVTWSVSEQLRRSVLRCVTDGMDVLGEQGKQTVLYHMEVRFGLSEAMIPHDPHRFVLALEHIFGNQAQVVIHAILERMRVNANCDREYLRFAKALEDACTRDSALVPNYLAQSL